MTTASIIGWAIAFTCVGLSILVWLASLVGRAISRRREQDAQTVTDFGEPTRAEVEATLYGPLAMYGPKDVIGDIAMPISESETARAFRALIAADAAGCVDDEWATWGGAAS